MGYIKEPDGVDFEINGKPLTEKQKKEISEFIKADKDRLFKLRMQTKESTIRQNELGKKAGLVIN